ncbi:MAG: HD domain-containing protein [Chitinivibrionales bacterium]|nr:HD domain-containing protein [Chitinivibrionales bacterium]MBD3395844.1 HD domain-containing protein [Chitinivibrionales bacterium]
MKTESDIRKYLLEEEERLSPFAKKSSESMGRRSPLSRDPFRLEFARDETRILHSPPFRRLKHKTQVFLSPDNDHICTRMEHVLHVSSISSVIGRCLNLNIDLINAIAKAHDLGHAPFGHAGERCIDTLLKNEGVKQGFIHEIHGLRVVDKLTNYGAGLNLTYEVRDGIVTHCGEKFERRVAPDRGRDLLRLEEIADHTCHPSTLEGCLVRMVDRIAYLGRDLEDGIKAGLVKKSDVPREIARDLGTENGKIIGRLVHDLIANSIDTDAIQLSKEVFQLMNRLKDFNYDRIYRHPDVEVKAQKATRILDVLFYEVMRILKAVRRGKDTRAMSSFVKDAPSMAVLFDFIKNTNYTDATPHWRVAADYVAGMSDAFAQRTYAQLFLPSPVV